MCHLYNKTSPRDKHRAWNKFSCARVNRIICVERLASVILQSLRENLPGSTGFKTAASSQSSSLGNSQILWVKLHDLVNQGHLIRDVVVVEEVWPTLTLLKVPNLSWRKKRGRKGKSSHYCRNTCYIFWQDMNWRNNFESLSKLHVAASAPLGTEWNTHHSVQKEMPLIKDIAVVNCVNTIMCIRKV